MQEITINLPAIDDTLIDQIQAETTLAFASEVEAAAKLRAMYAQYARHNGYVRTAYSYNQRKDEAFLRDDEGGKVRAFLVVDHWSASNYRGDQNRGSYGGTRLYLTAAGEWVRLERVGSWSEWQGEGEGWTCGVNFVGENDDTAGGSIDTLDDAAAVREFSFEVIVAGLSEALRELSQKLPERLRRIRARAQFAAVVLAALRTE